MTFGTCSASKTGRLAPLDTPPGPDSEPLVGEIVQRAFSWLPADRAVF
ncbi:hypothetical protein AvCA_12310 [Azotobacter vinelandii CA]|uniref:Uncharacterized protein n=2 Tax=Azotobacter vinelandii TaxID=354 RepID=C1DQ06_AZOVD|nr:hypothetical protein Avin_12310 [Azotobacter vinelandii DJ]AGK17052.1 hypothetical protein AvCA_12310 [Azotobacter vinelandii CA]AGK19806.1 hypothetical protein AvCA6_12310 [Azotobacter vinelandii CA6]